MHLHLRMARRAIMYRNYEDNAKIMYRDYIQVLKNSDDACSVYTCKQLHVSHVIPDQYSQWHWKPSRNELVVDELLVLTYRLYVNNVNTTYRRTCAYSLSQRCSDDLAALGVATIGGKCCSCLPYV